MLTKLVTDDMVTGQS